MRRQQMWAVALAVAALGVLPACKTTSSEDLKNSFEVVDHRTSWVSTFYQAWPPRLKLAPQIVFRVKNISDKPLTYVNFNATFVSKDDQKNLGDALLAAIRGKALGPGEISDEIVLKCNSSVEGKNKQDFLTNPGWEPYQVKLFAQSRGSLPVLIAIFEVSRDIDFEEDEPVGEVKKGTGN